MNTSIDHLYSPATLAMFAACEEARATFTDFEKGLWRQKIDASMATASAEIALKEAQRAVVEARRKLRVAEQDSRDVDQVFLSTQGGARWERAAMADYSHASKTNAPSLVLENGTATVRAA